MKVKITHLTSVHNRYDPRIFQRICHSLAKTQLYTVSLVVADGKGDETIDGINILDVGAKPSGRIPRMTKTVMQVFVKAKSLDSAIYHLHDSELIPIGLILKKLGKKVVFDIHEDLVLQISGKNWIPLLFRQFLSIVYENVEIYACKRFDLLIVPQEAMRRKFENFNKTIMIANYPKKFASKLVHRSKFNRFRLLYAGVISGDRGIWNMLNMIQKLSEFNNSYNLTLAGEIDDDLLKKIQTHEAWKVTTYLGNLSKKELSQVYKDNSIGLILFNNVGQYGMSSSLKLYEYMQNGIFVIMPDFGDWLGFNESYKVGINVNTSDSVNTARVIHQLDSAYMEIVSNENVVKVDKFFTWESQEVILVNGYKSIE